MSGANASPEGRSNQEKAGANASPARSDQAISDPEIIFKDLPATFPEKDKYKKTSLVSSMLFHVVLIAMVLIVPLLLPQSISERELLITLVSPIGPPPPPPAPPVEAPLAAVPHVTKPEVRPAIPNVLVMPTAVPKEI